MELSHGGWRAKMIADSISEAGIRLTTMEVRFPRIVLAEFNTHRVFSRNSASSRAIPIEKMIKMVEDDSFVPSYWGANQKGMQADGEIDPSSRGGAIIEWDMAKRDAIRHAKHLNTLGVHKQIVNRLLEPFMWHTCIVTSTEWSNFFALRCDSAAAPEIRNVAILMRKLYEKHIPTPCAINEYHLPYIDDEDWDLVIRRDKHDDNIQYTINKISVARCARVSYLTHDGKRDHEADLNLYDRLLNSRHMSPFEHVATPMRFSEYILDKEMYWSGNFYGWNQLRKEIPFEHDASSIPMVPTA